MSNDCVRAESIDDDSAFALPELPVLFVTANADVDHLIRSARADLARLRLQLRTVEREADDAERAAKGDVDALGLGGDLRSSIVSGIAQVRAERDADLERAREESRRWLRAAQDEADSILSAAKGDVIRALLGGPRQDSPAVAPVVTPPPPPPPPPPAPPAPASPAPASPAPPPAAPPMPPLPSAPATRPAARKPSVKDRYLHADVMLPLIAVVIVVIILLAWVS